ncbi:hypothetical protein Tco_0122461, partial [Tanacetum coccineum]
VWKKHQIFGSSDIRDRKIPKGVLKTMESIRSKFFNGVDSSDRKIISWVAWEQCLSVQTERCSPLFARELDKELWWLKKCRRDGRVQAAMEDVQHVSFDVTWLGLFLRKICSLVDFDWQENLHFLGLDAWFSYLFGFSSRLKSIGRRSFLSCLERIWRLRNQLGSLTLRL